MADDAEHLPRLHIKGDISESAKLSSLPGIIGTTLLPPGERSREAITKRIVTRLQAEGIAFCQAIPFPSSLH